jgi:hypothetical protein
MLVAHRDGFGVDGSGRVGAMCSAVPGRYLVVSLTLAAGAAWRWWRDLRYLVRREDRSWEHPYHRLMLRAHFPWTCGLAIEENGYWYVTPEVGIC